jgi:DNA excision repair protein ERCC-4
MESYQQLYRYLLTYDALSFHAYLETLIASPQPKSPWLLTDHANTIFQLAKRRCYKSTPSVIESALISGPSTGDELSASLNDSNLRERQKTLASVTNSQSRESWLPDGMHPVLEELPKWNLVTAVMDEIEEEIVLQESLSTMQAACE